MEEAILEKPEEMDYFDFIDQAIFNGDANKLVLFELSTEDCSVCPEQEEIIEKIESDLNGNLTAYKIDLGYPDNYDFGIKLLKVRLLPTILIFFGNVKNMLRIDGKIAEDKLRTILEDFNNICLRCKSRGQLLKNDFYKCKKHKIEIYAQDSCPHFKNKRIN